MSFYPKKKGRKHLSKKIAERRHATRRASERYNIKLTRKLRLYLVKSIQKGDAVLIRKLSLRQTEWLVYIPGLECCDARVIYDCRRHEIVTFVPLAPKDL